ncbi:hypothetical protein AVEN_166358-1 [Araneus ventricosus]|uniref:Uncharacterized protein n=1 Tax=Araneus ventricosus TaxID=182803 RepID=A0A4Y2JIU5_ARAVE|nr:hypothetical protein AVEN_166358-1 [Araneus ventricosus]
MKIYRTFPEITASADFSRGTVVTACSDLGYNDQSVVLNKMAWNGSPTSKHIENLPVVVNGFDEMTPQHMRTIKMKRNLKKRSHQLKKLLKPFVL